MNDYGVITFQDSDGDGFLGMLAQTLADRPGAARVSRSALTALASSTNPKPSLYFSVAVSCSTRPRSLNVVSSRYAVDLWKSSSLATSVTPDHPRARQELHNGDGAVDRLYRRAPTYQGAHKRRSYTTFCIPARSPLSPYSPCLPTSSSCVRWLAKTPNSAVQALFRVGEEGSWPRGWTQGSRSRWWLRSFLRPRLFLGSRPALEGYSPGHLALLRFLVASFVLAIYAVISGIRVPAAGIFRRWPWPAFWPSPPTTCSWVTGRRAFQRGRRAS